MIINGKRALAYPVIINEVKEHPNADRLDIAIVGGWQVIVGKGEFKSGDTAMYFEIDSKLPDKFPFNEMDFLKSKHYKIKTQKIRGSLSQGFIVSLDTLGLKIDSYNHISDNEGKKYNFETDFTDIIGVTYSDAEDNKRKKDNPNAKYDSMKSRHKKLFCKPYIKWLMKKSWGRKLLFFIFGRKKDKPRGFPEFISKTDEERIENQPWRLQEGKSWVMTEKLDGTSCTYALKRLKRNKFEFYVCSRNVRQKDENQNCYHDHNIYWDLAFKYNIETMLKNWLITHLEDEWVAIQGEGVGSVQGNPLKLKEDDLYVFNFKTSSKGRLPSLQGKDTIEGWGMKWVPVLGICTLPHNMEDMKKMADGKSQLNPEVIREGIVYRSSDGKESFKNVSNEYLLSRK